jgi:hypothetical protein
VTPSPARLRPPRRLSRRRLFAATVILVLFWLLWPVILLFDDLPALGALARLAPALGGLRAPVTFLLVVQNEDELRGTGGFITAVGTVTIDRGRVRSLDIEDSFAVDDFNNVLYPQAPEPIRVYMDAPLWVLRDANWSPNLPTVAPFVAALYSATRPGPLDGVITVDQAALRFLLEGTGPIRVEGIAQPITARNVVEVMRAARNPAPGQEVGYEWWLQRKDFMPDIARQVLKKAPFASWPRLADSAIRALDQRHVQIWLEDPQAAALLAERGWDGALRAGGGDFLMVVEGNVGFNKVNAVTRASIAYAVDLRDPAAPSARVTVTDHNPAAGSAGCVPGPDYGTGTYDDLVNRCFWNYLRVLTPTGAQVASVTNHAIPAEWLLLGEMETGRVRVTLESEAVQAIGTLVVVPPGETAVTEYAYSLPAGVLATDGATVTYTLHVQKQSGTQAVPFELEVALPPGAALVSASPRGRLSEGAWRLARTLAEDVPVRLTFRLP